MHSRRHTGSREKGADHGKKNTGVGGAQAEVVEPVAQHDRRRAARVEGKRLREIYAIYNDCFSGADA